VTTDEDYLRYDFGGCSDSLTTIWLKYFRYREYKDDAALFEIAKYDLEHKLTGARVLDIAIYPDSTVKVNYAYDKLYDVDMNYERDGRIKKMTMQYGISRDTWIAPNTTTLEILDAKAETIYKRP